MQTKPSRNDSCPCGSGKKYKQCCMHKKNNSLVSSLRGRVTSVNTSNDSKNLESSQFQNKLKGEPVDLMKRAFGNALATYEDEPPIPPSLDYYLSKDFKS